MNKIYLIVAVATLVVMQSCNSLKEPELKKVEIIELSREAGEGLLHIDITYNNPNNKRISLKKLNIEGFINQKSLGSFTSSQKQSISSGADHLIELKYNFNPDEIYTGFLSKQFGAIGSKRVRISIDGRAFFEKDDMDLEVPVAYSEVYKLKI